MLLEEASRKNIEIGFDLNHIPETRWMVTALGTLKPTHKIFEKSYKPVIKEKKANLSFKLDNADHFYDDLP